MDSKAIMVALVVVVVVFSVFVTTTFPASAIASADNFGVEDASGYKNTTVLVPVNITNVQSGPVICIIFDILYNNNIITVVGVQKGDLTPDWDSPSCNNFDWGSMVSIVYDGIDEHAIQNGSNGSVVVLNFSVIGEPLETSRMNFTNIELADTEYKTGTAPAKNGTFTVENTGSVSGRVIYACNTTGITGVTIILTQGGSMINSTVTDVNGNYSFTDVPPGDYDVNASKTGFWDNSTSATVTAGVPTTVDLMLWLKGDLDGDGDIAGADDLLLMKKACLGLISGDRKYNLNGNGKNADIGDLVLMKRAYLGEIILS